ncbi:MAG: hypothetical protein IID33_10445, partial [Planctomycetes bacterium]|nr:hypothetical protein [Planctomycetota bacterium]
MTPSGPSRLFVVVAVVSCTWTAPARGQALWRERGPAPISSVQYAGRVSAVACSPSDPERYFIGGADGGVWRTTDGGTTWTALTEHMPTTSIGALIIDPLNENTIYAGTGEANYANHSRYGLGLYKSTDGGDTWTQHAESTFGGRCFSKMAINPANPQILYAAITRAGGFPELAAAKGHPGATGPLGVFRSLDGGENWTHLTGGLPNLSATDIAIDPVNPNNVYAGIGRIFGNPDNGVYKSTDGGNSWTKLAGGLPTANIGRIALDVAPSSPQRVYVLIARPSNAFGGGASTLGAFRSNDGGATWTSLPIGSLQATYGWYLAVVAVHPVNPDLVVMGGLNLRRSTSAGASWSTITPPHVDLHAAAWDANLRLLTGDDGGVHRSLNDGSNWSSINNNLGTIQFYAGLSTHPTNNRIMVGGAQDNGSNRRSTAGRTWDQIFGGDGGWTQLDQNAPNIVFVEFQGTGNLFRSTNGGGSFGASASGINTSDRNCFLPPYLIDPTNSSRMIYGTHRLYESNNGGLNWSPISGDLTTGSGAIRALAFAPSNSQVVYAATNDGNFLRSDDGGNTFDLLLADNPGWPRVTREIFVHPSEPMTVYLAVASFGEDQVLRSTDGGQSWVTLDGDLPDLPVNVIAVDVRGPTPAIYAGSDAGLFRSVNDGVSWHRYGLGLPNVPIIDIL